MHPQRFQNPFTEKRHIGHAGNRFENSCDDHGVHVGVEPDAGQWGRCGLVQTAEPFFGIRGLIDSSGGRKTGIERQNVPDGDAGEMDKPGFIPDG